MLPLDDVKSWLKITTDTEDAQIQVLINRATEIIERETLWYFGGSRAVEDVLDGTGTDVLFMRQPAIEDPPVVVVSSRAGPTDAWTVVDAAYYEVEGRRLLVAGAWSRGRRNYRAVYNEGFSEPPGDVAQLLLDLVGAKWGGRSENMAFKSEKIGDYNYVRGDLEQLDQWRIVENNWRRLRI